MKSNGFLAAIRSSADVLVIGESYGVDGCGIGKLSGYETMVQLKDGALRKFLGDVSWAVAGWFNAGSSGSTA